MDLDAVGMRRTDRAQGAPVVRARDLGAVDFAGPLVIATMMMLFFKSAKTPPTPWVLSGITALILFEIDSPDYAVLLVSVLIGLIAAIWQTRRAGV